MSAASTVTVAAPGTGLRPPFTVEQWQELEHQALIYKYLVAGLSVPPDLLVPIQRSFESISARFFHQSSLGYCSYFGKKIDPEPGRCRRTDGKKWRCSRDAYPDSKYCERHMNRGRSRSRKPVESQCTSQPLSTAISRNATGSSSGTGSFQSLPSHSIVSDQASLLGNNAAKWQMEPASYGINNKDLRYLQGVKSGADEQGLHPEGDSGSAHVLSMDRSSDNIWNLTPSSVRVNRSGSSSYSDSLQSNACQPHMLQNFESTSNPAMAKRQQHCFFGSKIGSPGSVEQESNTMRTSFGEWPRAGDSWTNLGDQGYDRSAFSTTELSISVPISLSEMSSRNACSPRGD